MDYWFSENLKRCRKEKGMTQLELAEKIGVSRVAVCEWEINVRYPTMDRLYDIANALDVEVECLVKHPMPC